MMRTICDTFNQGGVLGSGHRHRQEHGIPGACHSIRCLTIGVSSTNTINLQDQLIENIRPAENPAARLPRDRH
jgi:hypothetical protein